MRKRSLKQFYIWVVFSLIAMFFIFVGVNAGTFKAFAESPSDSNFRGITGSPEDAALYNATNTYAYKGENEFGDRAYVYYDTSVEGKNSNVVSVNAPLITVLTHGLGGDASHWSNVKDEFAYDKDSMFARLEQELLKNGGSGSNMYWAVMQSSAGFKLYDLNDENNRIVKYEGTPLEYIEYTDKKTTDSITDISKHIILIFQSSVSGEYNYKVYEEFNYMLSKIIYDVKMLSGGVLPRVNLIGHSRGGITNLQYALDHPELVASIFSLGTPYFGSDTAATPLGAGFAAKNGREDIISKDIYLGYYNRWHDNYDRLYSEINTHALGGYSDTDYLFDTLIEYLEIAGTEEIGIEGLSPDILTTIKSAIKNVPWIVNALDEKAEIFDFLFSLFRDGDYNEEELSIYVPVVADIQYFGKDNTKGFWENFVDNFLHNLPFVGCPYFMNDLLVDLPSQTGFDQQSVTERSYGFKVYAKCYETSDFEDGEEKKLSSFTDPAVVHNLEARDEDLIDYVLSNITLGGYEGYIYKQTSISTATLVGYSGDIISTEIALPSQIDGLTVDCIGSDLFKGEGDNITSIIIPDTVEWLKDYAFAGLKSLVNVVISQESELKIIGSKAFLGCSKLVNYNVTKNVIEIASDAFLGCSKFEAFSVSEWNSTYSGRDGALFNKAGTKLLHYPEGKNVDVLEVPSTITEIEPYAFSNNEGIEKLHIYGTPRIGNFAFFNCTNLRCVYFYSDTVPTIGSGAFTGNTFTLYVPYDSQNLYNNKFAGFTNDIASISITVTLKSDNVQISTLNTYYGAKVNVESPLKVGYTFDCWSDSKGNDYRNGEKWNSTENLIVNAKWTACQYYINFSGNGTDDIADKLVTYDEEIGQLPEPDLEGRNFIGWKDEYGNYYTSTTIWKIPNNLTLFADYSEEEKNEAVLYKVVLQKQGGVGGSESVNAEYGKPMPAATAPTRVGYNFEGYYTKQNGGDKYYDENMASVRNWDITSETTLYAHWVGKKYLVEFNKNGGDGGTCEVEVIYGAKMPERVEAPKKIGHIFTGYYDESNGKQYYTGSMSSDVIWDKAENFTLYAGWAAIEYEIVLDLGYTSYNNSIYIGYGKTVVADEYTKYVYNRIGYDFIGFFSSDGEKYFGYDIVLNSSEYCYELVSLNKLWKNAANGVLYARWAIIDEDYKYEIVISNSDEAKKVGTIHLKHGSTVTITAPTLTGYTFEKMWINGVYNQTNTYQLIDVQLKRNLKSKMTGFEDSQPFYLWYPYYNGTTQMNRGGLFMVYQKEENCIAAGSLITLADGRRVPVETLKGNEMLLVWNLHTGNFDVAPILFIDHDAAEMYKIINLYFSDGT